MPKFYKCADKREAITIEISSFPSLLYTQFISLNARRRFVDGINFSNEKNAKQIFKKLIRKKNWRCNWKTKIVSCVFCFGSSFHLTSGNGQQLLIALLHVFQGEKWRLKKMRKRTSTCGRVHNSVNVYDRQFSSSFFIITRCRRFFFSRNLIFLRFFSILKSSTFKR